jgi:rod shape-determining protein MreC
MLSSLLTELKTLLLLIFIASFLMVFDEFGFLDSPKKVLQQVTLPIQYGLYQTSVGFSRQFGFIFTARKSAQENKALKEQLGQLLSENSNIRRKLSETEGLLSQQKTLSPQTLSLLPARPIGLSRYLYIDKGSDDGVKVNQALLFKDNFLGLVKEVSAKRSAILLSTDPDSHLSAFVQNNQGKAKGILNGKYGSELILDKVLHQEQIQKGDLVYSEGTEIEIPKGLILGQVSEVVDKDNEVFKSAKVKTNFDPSDLDVVFLVIN